MTATCLGHVGAVLRGPAVPFTRPGSHSAIAKFPVTDPVAVGTLGLEGDEQGDPRVHGGPDKAVHQYAQEHYAPWRTELGSLPVLATPGAFGENLASSGVTEQQICLGDQVRVGSVLLEVSQSRQPCWKLNDRFGVPDMARRVQQTGRTGWYYRVLEPGTLQAGDPLTLVARPWPQWPLVRIIDVLYHQPFDAAVLSALATLPLPPPWRRLVEGRLAHGVVENWSTRLEGPTLAPAALP
ncbi:MOSC domain-containing protein [Simplicispira psychrophila]|uniref:MOSC domain-containing protein n=1 Tax=Simplicispira psychrophila TaxID=80882 RepID=UPI000482F4A1|nr:MOSC domain-containing protein [Simplicispira psychrophila]